MGPRSGYNPFFQQKQCHARLDVLSAHAEGSPRRSRGTSHRLMLRAAMIRRLAAGIYTWLPLGLRVLRKVEAIVRDEMNRAGAIELLMPVVQPAELWQETGRWGKYGPELLAPQGPAPARLHRPAHVRGSHHRPRTEGDQQLQAAADQFLSYPDEIPRRGPPALRRDALARIRDEGRLFVRRRPCRDAGLLPGDVRRVRADLHADGPQVPRGRRRHGADRRQRVARIPGAGRFRRGRDRMVPRVRLCGEHRARGGARPRRGAPGRGRGHAEGAHARTGDLRGGRRAAGPAARAHRQVHHARRRRRGRPGARAHAADPRRSRAQRGEGQQDSRPREIPLGERGGNRRRDRLPARLSRAGRHSEGPPADRRPVCRGDGRLRLRRQPRGFPPARRQFRPRLPGARPGRRSAQRRRRRPVARRQGRAGDPARDRGRPRVRARHALLAGHERDLS